MRGRGAAAWPAGETEGAEARPARSVAEARGRTAVKCGGEVRRRAGAAVATTCRCGGGDGVRRRDGVRWRRRRTAAPENLAAPPLISVSSVRDVLGEGEGGRGYRGEGSLVPGDATARDRCPAFTARVSPLAGRDSLVPGGGVARDQ